MLQLLTYNFVSLINSHSNLEISGTTYGRGCYFAVKASKSHNYTEQGSERYLFLCYVLTGEFTVSNRGTLTTPKRNTSSRAEKYDSTVDDVTNPSMFITFQDYQAYPAYLVKYK